MRIISAFPKGLTARPRRPLRARRANFRPTPDRQTASCDWSASLSRLRALTTMAPPARVTATVLFLTNCAVNAYKTRSSAERGFHWVGVATSFTLRTHWKGPTMAKITKLRWGHSRMILVRFREYFYFQASHVAPQTMIFWFPQSNWSPLTEEGNTERVYFKLIMRKILSSTFYSWTSDWWDVKGEA